MKTPSTANGSTASGPAALLGRLPKVDRLLLLPEAAALLKTYSRPELLRALRDTLDALRREMASAARAPGRPAASGAPEPGGGPGSREELEARAEPAAVLEAAQGMLKKRGAPAYQRAINGTGIILHTGLGRAVLAEAATDALSQALGGYTIVELDRGTGERNRRESAAASLLCELTGAEAATAVNNNAAATLIILSALARGKEVILSRGQLIEIGGAFRMPRILEESGARLVEVGTTNRTYLEDYREALTPETGMLLQVHTSNYEIAGFARHTPLEELVALGRERGIPVVSDLGSGCFVDLSPFGFRREPLVSDVVARGPDLVCFSGDKLLGGPQAGIILGKRELVEKIRAAPLYRAVRPDKMALIALEATLRLYRDPGTLLERLPHLRMIAASERDVRRRAESCRRRLKKLQGRLDAALVQGKSQAGSGSLPAQDLPSWGLALAAPGLPAEGLAARLRAAAPPIFTRIQDGRVVVDFRTLLPGEDASLAGALARICEDLQAHPTPAPVEGRRSPQGKPPSRRRDSKSRGGRGNGGH